MLTTNLQAASSWMEPVWVTATVIGAIVGFILIRRLVLLRQVQRYEARAFKVHGQWREIVRGDVSTESWRNDRVQRQIVQSIVLQEIGAAAARDRPRLQDFLRANGLVEACIEHARIRTGAARRQALLALGAMRVPESIVPLSDALDDWQLDTRIAAVRALGRTGLPEAAEPIIESLMVGGLKVPDVVVANALGRCYA